MQPAFSSAESTATPYAFSVLIRAGRLTEKALVDDRFERVFAQALTDPELAERTGS